MIDILRLAPLVGAALLGLSAQAATYYVSPSGDNAASGTLERPFATLQYAADRLVADDTLYVRAGAYYGAVTVRQSGTALSPITIRAYAGECPVLIGSSAVAGPWRVYKGSIYQTAWPDRPLQVFADGHLLNEARWPNTRPEDFENMTFALTDGGTQDFVSSAALPDVDLTGAWVHVMAGQSWVVYSRQVGVHDRASGKLTFAQPVNAMQELIPRRGNRFYVDGRLELLDSPGEWWWDAAARQLYVWMPDGGSPEGRVEAGTAPAVLDLSGRSYVVVQGLSARGGWFNLQNSAYCTVRDCHLRAPNWVRNVDGYNIWPQYLGGIDVSGHDNLIDGGSVRLAGSSGVHVSGTANTVRHVTVEDSGWTWANQAGILARESDQALIEHNTIRRSAMAGVVMGTRTRVLANLVEDSCLATEDCGNLNAWNTDGQGAELAYNLLRGNRTRWGAAIYLDAYTTNFNLHDNVAENIEWSGVNVTGPVTIQNNTFADVQHQGINQVPTPPYLDWSAGRALHNVAGQPFPMTVTLNQPASLIPGWAYYFTYTTLHPAPRRVEILWPQLVQPAWSTDQVPMNLSAVDGIAFAIDGAAEPFRFTISNLRLLPVGGAGDVGAVPVSGASWRFDCKNSTDCRLSIGGMSSWGLSGSTPIGGTNSLTADLPAQLKDFTKYRGLAFELAGTASRGYGFQGFADMDNGPDAAAGRGATLPANVGADASRAWPVCASSARVNAKGVINAASNDTTLAPGCLASVYGADLAGGTYSDLYRAPERKFPSSYAGVSVSVNGNPAPLTYVSPRQINFQVPWGTVSPATVQVTRDGAASNGEAVALAATAPSVFQSGGVAILACAGGAPQAGAVCTLWGNGFGPKRGTVRNGEPAGSTPYVLSDLEAAACTLTIGGKAAEVVYCGAAPGQIIDQLNFVYPGGIAGGSSVEGVLTIGSGTGRFQVAGTGR